MTEHRNPVGAILLSCAWMWQTWFVLVVFSLISFLVAIDQSVYLSHVTFENSTNDERTSVYYSSVNTRHNDWSQVQQLTIGSGNLPLILDPATSPLYVDGGLPKLKKLTIPDPITGKQMSAILKHLQLEALSVNHVHEMTEQDWKFFSQQPMKYLKIHSLANPSQIPIVFPPTLETVEVDTTRCLPMGLSDLPRLTTVHLATSTNLDRGLDESELRFFAQSRSLRRLYVESSRLAVMIQRQLPEIAVRPVVYQANRIFKLSVLSMVGTGVLFFLLHLLSLQFASSSSLLLPGFQRDNFSVALGFFFVISAIQIANFMIGGFAFGPAMALAGAPLISAYLLTIGLTRIQPFAGFINFPLSLSYCMIVCVLTAGAAMLDQPEIDWMIQGGRPDLVIVFVILESLALTGFHHFFAGLSRRLSEQASNPVPFELWHIKPYNAWPTEGRRPRPESWIVRFTGSGYRRRLARLLNTPRGSKDYQSRLWHAGMNETTWSSIAMSPIYLSAAFLFFDRTASEWIWQYFSVQIGIIALIQPAAFLDRWRPYLSRHLLTPLKRRDWVNLIFRQIAWDYLPAVAVTLVFAFQYRQYSFPQGWNVGHALVTCLAAIGLVYATTLHSMTYKLTKRIAMFIIGGVFLLGLLLVSVACFADGQSWMTWPPLWWSSILVAAVLLGISAYRRWLNWELGTI